MSAPRRAQPEADDHIDAEDDFLDAAGEELELPDDRRVAVNPVAVNMAGNYDMKDEVDEKDAHSKVSNLKLDFDRTDIKFWFQQLEMHLSTAGVKAQWTKRLLLHKQLPADIIGEVKDLERTKMRLGPPRIRTSKTGSLRPLAPKWRRPMPRPRPTSWWASHPNWPRNL